MVERPEKFPKWADVEEVDPVSGQPNRAEPPEEKKESGWGREEIPPRQWLNWLQYGAFRWVEYLDDRLIGGRIATPVAVVPLENEEYAAGDVVLKAKDYSPLYSAHIREFRQFQVDVEGGDFSSPVREKEIDANEWAVDPILDHSADYKWRCRDKSTWGYFSRWTAPVSFSTKDAYIEQPTNLSPEDNEEEVDETPLLVSSEFGSVNYDDTHVASRYRIYKVADGSEVYDSGELGPVEEHEVPGDTLEDGEKSYEWEVAYEGDELGWSDWSEKTTFTTTASFDAVFSGSTDDEVHKIDPADMTQVGSAYTGHIGSVFALAFGTDGYLYSGSTDDEVHKIDPADMTQVGSAYTGHIDRVFALAFGTDGYLFSGSNDDEVHKIDPADMTQVGSAYTGHTGAVYALACTKNIAQMIEEATV